MLCAAFAVPYLIQRAGCHASHQEPVDEQVEFEAFEWRLDRSSFPAYSDAGRAAATLADLRAEVSNATAASLAQGFVILDKRSEFEGSGKLVRKDGDDSLCDCFCFALELTFLQCLHAKPVAISFPSDSAGVHRSASGSSQAKAAA